METEKVKTVTLIVWLCLGATPAFAQATATATSTAPCSACGLHGAPAPQIGLGIPSAVAVGGVLLGASLLRRRRRR
jgi:hypothetical protein